MAAGVFNNPTRAEKWLAALNSLVATTNLLLFPCCGCVWSWGWMWNDPLDKWPQQPQILLEFAWLGGVVLLGGMLGLGFLAGFALRKGDRWGRFLTGVLVIVAAFHLLFAMLYLRWEMVQNPNSQLEIGGWLLITLYLGPSLLYCIAAPLLLRVQNQPSLADVETDAQALWQPPDHRSSAQGIIEGNQILGTTIDRPEKTEPSPRQESEDD